MSKETIYESMHKEKEWFEQTKHQTLSSLPAFINHVMNGYAHDYGTVCHAIAACAVAAAWAANEEKGACGGITGFQAGFVMWDFIRQWQKPTNTCGLKLVDYDDMLYPQYSEKFQKTISRVVWKALQEEAKKRLDVGGYAAGPVLDHWRSIVEGKVPFGYTVVD